MRHHCAARVPSIAGRHHLVPELVVPGQEERRTHDLAAALVTRLDDRGLVPASRVVVVPLPDHGGHLARRPSPRPAPRSRQRRPSRVVVGLVDTHTDTTITSRYALNFGGT